MTIDQEVALSTHTFVYPDYGTPPSLPDHVAHSDQTCTIVRELGDDERDEEVGPMFIVRFEDGVGLLVFGEELDPRPESALLELRDGEWWKK